MKKRLFFAMGLLALNGCYAQNPPTQTAYDRNPTMNIQIQPTNSNDSITAVLADNPTAKDFYNALPLTLTLENYGGVEKISRDIPKLSTQNAPKSHAAQAGDLTYYAPWGNLAIFTGNFGSASGLVYFGRINKGLDKLTALPGKTTVTIKKLENP